MLEKPKRKNDEVESPNLSNYFVGCVVVLMIVAVALIVMLAILTPVIGNIFSNINCMCLPANL